MRITNQFTLWRQKTMKLVYKTDIKVGNMEVNREYVLNRSFVKSNIEKLVKYFTNLRSKDSSINLVIDLDIENDDNLLIHLVDGITLSVYSANGFIDGYYTNAAMRVSYPRHYKEVLLSFV